MIYKSFEIASCVWEQSAVIKLLDNLTLCTEGLLGGILGGSLGGQQTQAQTQTIAQQQTATQQTSSFNPLSLLSGLLDVNPNRFMPGDDEEEK